MWPVVEPLPVDPSQRPIIRLNLYFHHHPASFLTRLTFILVEGFASIEKPNFRGSTVVPSDGLNSYFMRRCVITNLTVLAPKNRPGHECVPNPKLSQSVSQSKTTSILTESCDFNLPKMVLRRTDQLCCRILPGGTSTGCVVSYA